MPGCGTKPFRPLDERAPTAKQEIRLPLVTTQQLLDCLVLDEVEEHRYRGSNLPLEYHRIFGGQLLAQIIVASTSSAPGKVLKSVHVSFCREGEGGEPVDYIVESRQDGRTFATRTVTALQGDRVIGAATALLHSPDDDALMHQSAVAPALLEPGVEIDLGMVPFATRVGGDFDLASTTSEPPVLQMSFAVEGAGTEEVVHQALLAYATDLTLIGTALRPIEGISQSDAHVTLQTAVISHTVWYHLPVDLSGGIVVDQHVPSLRRGRGFGLGHCFASDGALVASFAQESLIRPSRQ